MNRSRTTPLARLAATVLAVGLATSLLPAAPASAATQRIRASFFGMHDGNPVSWPSLGVGSIRLWDSGVTWREIETAPGVYDFSRLDAQVDAARARGARVLLVLGQTPRFHSTRPGLLGSYGLGAASMPTETSWKSYVGKVVRRYQGRGVDYQVWNEANVDGYWRGSAAQMATLTKLASRVVANNDSAAKVVAPAFATRLTTQRADFRTYYSQRTGGKNVSAYIDVVSVNLYPLPDQKPEASLVLLAAARTLLRRAGVSKPIWNTEINYGLKGGGIAKDISRRKEAAYVARTYVLNAASGVKRTFWYAWDLQKLANTQLTYTNGTSLTRAGRAYGTVRSWLLGTRASSCTRDSRGTYECVATYSDGVRHIYWNPSRKTTIQTPATTTSWTSLGGVSTSIGSGKSLSVNYAPKMVRSRR